MAASTVIKNLNDGAIQFTDGSGTPVVLSIPFTTGDLSISGLSETQNAVSKYETRGVFHTARHTARTYPSGSFSFMVADYSDATSQTAIDFIMKSGSYSANTSTSSGNGDVYTLDLQLSIEGTDLGDASDHTIVLTDCMLTMDLAEGDPNSATVTFECLGTVTIT